MEAIDTTTGYVMQQGSKERQTVSLVKRPQRTRRINSQTFTTCSAISHGSEWHISTSIPTRDEKRLGSMGKQCHASMETWRATSRVSERHSKPKPLNHCLSKECTFRKPMGRSAH